MDKTYNLYCYEQGQGKPVVMLHGLVSTHRYMQEVYKLLPAGRFHVWAPDLLGMGRSPRPRQRNAYTLDAYLSSIASTVEARRVPEPFVLLGHSMGAVLAMRYAAQYLQKIKLLVLSGLPMFGVGTTYEQFIGEVTHGKVGKRRARLVVYGHYLLNLVPRRLLPRLFKNYPLFVLEDSIKHSFWSYLMSLWNAPPRHTVIEELKCLTVPVHLVLAEDDSIGHLSEGEIAAVRHQNITVTKLAGNHQLPLKHPQVFADIIAQA